ncbi:MAG: toxin-antitoxin system HicB family antitoxin [Acidobacteriota bacterium]
MNVKQLGTTEKKIYSEALEMVREGTTATGFSARFFGPEGLLRQLWTTEAERRALVESELYRWLEKEHSKLRARDAKSFAKEVQCLSGRLTVVVPRSLHAALKREAEQEHVSLSELIRLKLGIPYHSALGVFEHAGRRNG